MKTCDVCKIEKELILFHKKAMGYLGYENRCKDCRKKLSAEKYALNAHKIKAKTNEYKKNNKERIALRSKEYDAANAKAISERKAAYYETNKESILVRQKKYIDNNWDKRVAYEISKRKTNIQYRLAHNLRSRLTKAINGIGFKRGSAVKDLGCSLEELKIHLESKFTEGMSWENLGNKKGEWNIDHIIALSNVDLTDKDQFMKVCHYTNLQPMWAEENCRKGNR